MFLRSNGIQWLVVFLGNPGPKYANTRHNAGFLAADALSKSLGTGVNRLRFHALTGKAEIGGEGVLLMKPQTYMNNSGVSVGEAARFFKVPADRVIVVADDISMPCGKLRIRTKGSAGGHNGLKSIIQHLGTDKFPRLRVGVGAPSHPDYDMADWVLGTFSEDDKKMLFECFVKAYEGLEKIISDDVDGAMMICNGKKSEN